MNLVKKQEIENTLNSLAQNATLAWNDSHDKLSSIINERNYKIGVEIGLAYGNHSNSILKSTNIEKLFSIDPYKCYEEYLKDPFCSNQNLMDKLHDLVKLRLSYYQDRFELIRDYSEVAVKLFDDVSLDFVYIDGNHELEFIKKDLQNWWPKIKQGGIMSGHDYHHPNFSYVTTEVDAFAGLLNKKVVYHGNHVWSIDK